MNYVLVRVPPLAAGLPRPRFSLYLSSQLQYGIVLVFHRQCQLLLGVWVRLSKPIFIHILFVANDFNYFFYRGDPGGH